MCGSSARKRERESQAINPVPAVDIDRVAAGTAAAVAAVAGTGQHRQL